jgi:hypothetical protein
MNITRPTSLVDDSSVLGIGVRSKGNLGRSGMADHRGGSCEAANLSSKYAVGTPAAI